MKHILKSAGFALSGLSHAIKTERNIQQFLIGLLVYCAVGIYVGFFLAEWIVVFLLACFFLMVELLNTAMERLADTIDDGQKKKHGGHYHIGIKQAKDVAAAASLIALCIVTTLLGIMLVSHVLLPLGLID